VALSYLSITPTLRKDLETLRRYGILDRQMYRWGYYLGTGALRRDELQVAFNALASQISRRPTSQTNSPRLTKRLRGLDVNSMVNFFTLCGSR